jgi:hypothetical protein
VSKTNTIKSTLQDHFPATLFSVHSYRQWLNSFEVRWSLTGPSIGQVRTILRKTVPNTKFCYIVSRI